MLNVNMNYPYPLIRDYEEDYKETIFQGDLEVFPDNAGYVIVPNFNINNPEIHDLLDKGVFTYALQIQCVSTWFRKLFPIVNNKKLILDSHQLHERVEIIPCIISKQNVNGFTNDDFAEEYQGLSFELHVGDVIGIGTKRTFDALYQNDIIKNGSPIVKFSEDKETKSVSCDFTDSKINIKLPTEQYQAYLDCGPVPAKYPVLNAIYTIPALMEAIAIIREDDKDSDNESGYSNRPWYKTIVANLKTISKNDEAQYKNLLENAFTAAEMLFNNNSEEAIQFLVNN